MSKTETNNINEMDWCPENEIKLFYALRGHKPVGIGKNFHMIAILEELAKSTEKEVSSKTIWNRLNKLYDMETLDENEDLPFPNNTIPFTIEGIKEFDELIAKKFGSDGNKSDKESDNKEDTEVTTSVTKTGNKGKTQDSNKSYSKTKSETEKSSKSDRKEEMVKHSDKSDESEDQSKRSKKVLPKSSTELRSASHNTPSSAKKRK